MKILPYNREKAVAYSNEWALKRNYKYYDFSLLGGDCTNFVSQCLYSGSNVMNYTKDFGWYYQNLLKRAPAWTGVEFFYNFLIKNASGVGDGQGPFGYNASLLELEPGDFIQLADSFGDYFHSAIVVDFIGDEPIVSSHSRDFKAVSLSTFRFFKARGIKITGVRVK